MTTRNNTYYVVFDVEFAMNPYRYRLLTRETEDGDTKQAQSLN